MSLSNLFAWWLTRETTPHSHVHQWPQIEARLRLHLEDKWQNHNLPVLQQTLKMLMELFDQEQYVTELPPKPQWFPTQEQELVERYNLTSYRSWLADQFKLYKAWLEISDGVVAETVQHLHPAFTKPSHLVVPLIEAVKQPLDWLDRVKFIFMEAHQQGWLKNMMHTHYGRMHGVKGNTTNPRIRLQEAWLNTSAFDLFNGTATFELPDELLQESGIIIGAPGSGKSQLIEALAYDLMQRHPRPGLMILDSKGGVEDLFERLSRLDLFHPDHGQLRDRLVIFDPLETPPLSPFDLGTDNPTDAQINAAIETLEYFFAGLLGSGFTERQDRIMSAVIALLLRVPGSSLYTIKDVLDNPHQPHFEQVFGKLEKATADFWRNYNKKNYKLELEGITWRVDRVLFKPIGRMFSASRNAYNIAKAMNEGKIVLVSTATAHLGSMSSLVAKYFIGQFMNAALSRVNMPNEERRPAYLIVDEALPYIDRKTEQAFITLRSYKMGAIYAVQSAHRMGAEAWDIIGQCTSIKFAGGLEDKDINLLKPYMGRCTTEFLDAQKKEKPENPGYVRFGLYARGITPTAVSCYIRTGVINDQFMSAAAYRNLRAAHYQKIWPDTVDPPPLIIEASEPKPRKSDGPSRSYIPV